MSGTDEPSPDSAEEDGAPEQTGETTATESAEPEVSQAEEPKAEEPKAEEPKAEEPKAEEPIEEPTEEPEPVVVPSGGIEELTANEEASTFKEVVDLVRTRKRELDRMPDGPRPRQPGETYKRKKIFVDWHLQVNYIGVYLTTLVLLAIGFVALNYVFTSLYRRALAIQVHRPFDDQTNIILLGTLNLVFVLLLVIGMAVYAIIQSHRVAGPVLRFRRSLHQIHGRNYDFFLQLRQRDYLHDVADQLNGLNNSLKAKDIVIADAVLQLQRLSMDNPALAEDLSEVGANLCDVVLEVPLDEENTGT